MRASDSKSEHAAGAAVSRMASSAHEAVDKIADAATHAADSLDSKGQQMKALEERWLEKVREYVEHNPVQSLGIALASGFLLSRILSSR